MHFLQLWKHRCKLLCRLGKEWRERTLESKWWKYIMKVVTCPLENLPNSICHRHSEVGPCAFHCKDERVKLKLPLRTSHKRTSCLCLHPARSSAGKQRLLSFCVKGCGEEAVGWWVKENSRLWSGRSPAWAVNCSLKRFTWNVIVCLFNCL